MPDVPLSPLDFNCALSRNPETKARFVENAFKQLSAWGACILKNVPIPEPTIDYAVTLRREAFLQPTDVKRDYAADSLLTPGYTPLKYERYGDMEAGQPRETLTMNWTASFAEDGSKAAPDGNKYPPALPGAEAAYDALAESLDAFSRAFLGLMAERLGAPAHFFEQLLDGGKMIMRLLHYPPQNVERTNTRIVAHKDATLLTIILNADRPGLEMLAPDKKSWRPCKTEPNEIIVFAGEITEYLTNGAIRAAIHRVANDEDVTQSRYSTACFLSGNDIAILEPMKRTAPSGDLEKTDFEKDEPPRGETALQFVDRRLSSYHEDDYAGYERLPVQPD